MSLNKYPFVPYGPFWGPPVVIVDAKQNSVLLFPNPIDGTLVLLPYFVPPGS